MMTFDEFMQRMLDAFPSGQVGTDNYGQLIIYTGLHENDEGFVEEMEDNDA